MSIENVVDTLKQAKHETEKELASINQALEYLAPKKPSRSVGPEVSQNLVRGGPAAHQHGAKETVDVGAEAEAGGLRVKKENDMNAQEYQMIARWRDLLRLVPLPAVQSVVRDMDGVLWQAKTNSLFSAAETRKKAERGPTP